MAKKVCDNAWKETSRDLEQGAEKLKEVSEHWSGRKRETRTRNRGPSEPSWVVRFGVTDAAQAWAWAWATEKCRYLDRKKRYRTIPGGSPWNKFQKWKRWHHGLLCSFIFISEGGSSKPSFSSTVEQRKNEKKDCRINPWHTLTYTPTGGAFFTSLSTTRGKLSRIKSESLGHANI